MRWAGHVALMGQGRGVYFWWGNLRERDHWENPDADGIKLDLQEVGGGCGDWLELAQDRDRWWALVSMVMNIQVPKMRGIS